MCIQINFASTFTQHTTISSIIAFTYQAIVLPCPCIKSQLIEIYVSVTNFKPVEIDLITECNRKALRCIWNFCFHGHSNGLSNTLRSVSMHVLDDSFHFVSMSKFATANRDLTVTITAILPNCIALTIPKLDCIKAINLRCIKLSHNIKG